MFISLKYQEAEAGHHRIKFLVLEFGVDQSVRTADACFQRHPKGIILICRAATKDMD